MREDGQPTSRRQWIGLFLFFIAVVLFLGGAAYAAIVVMSKTCC